MSVTILHLSTVHPRYDTHILIKEAQTLASHFPCNVVLMIADGKRNAGEKQGKVSIHDMG